MDESECERLHVFEPELEILAAAATSDSAPLQPRVRLRAAKDDGKVAGTDVKLSLLTHRRKHQQYQEIMAYGASLC